MKKNILKTSLIAATLMAFSFAMVSQTNAQGSPDDTKEGQVILQMALLRHSQDG